MVLRDPFNRPVTNLRVSLTPRCNLRCIYCHSEGEAPDRRQMNADEIGAVLEAARRFEIRSVKFTGGEPTLREDLCEIIGRVPAGMESSMTTNGTLLADCASDLYQAGLRRVNVSLDSLDHENYRRITGSDLLGDVLEGIQAAEKAGLTPIKLNMVILEGINEHEVPAFLSFVRGNRNLVLQLIELLEQPGCSHYRSLDSLEEALASSSRQITTRRMHHRKKYCADGAEVEVVRPLHNTEFCAFCNRLRVTSDGRFKPCLLRRDNHVDILGAKGVELDSLFHEAVRRRAPFFT